MKQADKTLLEQMAITESDAEHRKSLLSFSATDAAWLACCKPVIETKIDALVDEFYEIQIRIPEVAQMIEGADTLARLRDMQRRYVLDLFGGSYGLDYISDRLGIGLAHKRIGVEPKFYLSAIHTLKCLLAKLINEALPEAGARQATLAALDKLLLFDITLVFETYIRSLVSEVKAEKDKSLTYARTLEIKVMERTQQLERLARTDPLTGLLNTRFLTQTLEKTLHRAQRHSDPVTFVYFDIDDFKKINDIEGHQRGDDVLRMIGDIFRKVSRTEDCCFRYGGDEFCIILTNCTESQAREIYMQRFNDALRKYRQDVTLSIGIFQTGPDHYDDPETVIRCADHRMYEAKRAFKSARQSSDT